MYVCIQILAMCDADVFMYVYISGFFHGRKRGILSPLKWGFQASSMYF